MSSPPFEAAPSRPPRLDHAAFGNGRVLGLVSPTSSIDWLCLPRFDSPSVFARLLDEERGGSFRVLHGGIERHGKLAYLANTNVVVTRFEVGDHAWEVVDFAPRLPDGLTVKAPIEIVRVLRPRRGEPRVSVDFDPRPGYALEPVELLQAADGITIRGGTTPLALVTNAPVPYVLAKRDFALKEPLFFVLSYGPRSELTTYSSVQHALDLTVAGWRVWSKTLALPMFAPAEVLRSALCLKLHANVDTGAIIAAATTSIPEAMHTPRTWDYRYCWLRDAAFVTEALRRLGHLQEGEAFLRYLVEVVASGPLQPLYGIGGERDLTERMLPHLAGFGGNGFVRIGNAACEQRQNDLMGEIVLCLETLISDPRLVHDTPEDYFPVLESLVETAIRVAPEKDTSIWEFRTMLRHYTFSRAMCWVAIHRGAALARRLGRHAEAERWSRIAEVERTVVLERGFNAKLGFFTQGLDGENADASNLLLPTLGIIDARDPRFVSTVRAYERDLVAEGLMQRYRNPDDFGETKSAFTICSFWWAEALAMMGDIDGAIEVFQRVMRYANPVGLFSEDIDPPTGALLGNFPQAYTHVGLIHAAMTINDLIEARDGRVRAWS